MARKASFPDEQNERKQNEADERRGEGEKKTVRNTEKKKRGERRGRLELNNPEIRGAN